MAVGIAFFRGQQEDDWIRRLIRFATRGPYTHCAVLACGRMIEACGRDRRTPWVKVEDAGKVRTEPGWDVIWFSGADDKEVYARACRLIDTPFNYSRVFLGVTCALLGPLGRWIFSRLEPRIARVNGVRPVDCTQLVHEIVGGVGWPNAATCPNDLFRRLWANGVTCYAKTGGFEK
jgi:hypothetical protein